LSIEFSRYGNWLGKSWAYAVFCEHQTEVNRLYWSFVPAADFCGYAARRADPGADLEVLFHAESAHVRRMAPDNDTWQTDFRDFENWVRLNMVMGMVSYFEIFMKSLLTTALKSDPAAPKGKPHAVDGLYFLKRDLQDVLSEDITPCLKGNWPSRLSHYRRIFGTLPPFLDQGGVVSDLDEIRTFRNGVGHTFGRAIDRYPYDLSSRAIPMQRLSQNRLQKWLALMGDVALAVEEHLRPAHIGEYELLEYYHFWKNEPRIGKEKSFTRERAFARAVKGQLGSGPPLDFCGALISYYDSL